MNKYRRKPLVIDAIQYNGQNLAEIMYFIGDAEGKHQYWACNETGDIGIRLPEGMLLIPMNSYVLKGGDHGFLSIKQDYFEANYEKAAESEIGDCEAGMVIETADVKACPHGFVFIALCQKCNLGN